MSRGRYVFSMMVCFVILAGVCCITTPVAAQKVGSMSTVQDVDASVVIVSAYYTDAEGDDCENDVIARFNIVLNGAQRYNLDLSISLKLPSGEVFNYYYSIDACISTLRCTMYFYDHATESGDYVLNIGVQVNNCGSSSDSTEYIFDPPGGSGDTDPCTYLMY